MYLFLDTKIITGLLCLGFLFTLVLIGAYGYNHNKGIPVKIFFFAKCSQTLAFIYMVLRGEISEFSSIFLANSLLFIGTSLEVIALLKLQNALRPKIKLVYLLFTTISIIGFYYIFLFYNKENVRIAYYSFITVITLFPAYRMVLGPKNTLLMRIVGSLYLLVIMATLIRGVTALVTSTVSSSFFTPGVYQLISLLSIFIFMTFGNIGFFLLMKEKGDQKLIHLANYDDLTGTLNRRAFTEKAKQHLINYAKKSQPISYLLFDIDNFKTINDTYGHHVGDQVLQDLTMRIKQLLGNNDLFVRYGGDEFGILLPGKDEIESNKNATQIQQMLNSTLITHSPVKYTISIGVLTVIPDKDTQLETLYAACDEALYKAKRNGRNNVSRNMLDKHTTSL